MIRRHPAVVTAALGALIALTAAAPFAVAQDRAEADSNVALPRYPAISPDGRTIVFSWHGDLWKVPVAGGSATRITAHPADETVSRFSPDGQTLAFVSDRRGLAGLYTVTLDGTGVEEVLVVDRSSIVSDFTDDGQLFFTGSLEPDVYRATRPYKVNAQGGVHERIHDAFGRSPVKEPGGDRILFVRGDESWSRRHKIGPDTRDVWLYADDAFTQLTTWRGNDGMPRWIGDGKFIYASNKEGSVVNLFLADADDGEEAEANAVQITSFADRDIDSFDVTPDGQTVVIHQWDSLYTLDLTDEGAEPKRLTISAAEDAGDRVKYIDADARADEAALSPDGTTMALVAYGQVYVRAADERAGTRRITQDGAHYKDIAWSPDGGTLYFVGDPDGREMIYAATVGLTRSQVKEALEAGMNADDATTQPATNPTTQPTTNPTTQPTGPAHAPDPGKWKDALSFHVEVVSGNEVGDHSPVPSPDATRLAFSRGVGDLFVLDLETGDETLIYDGWDNSISCTWSPDSRHLLINVDDADFNSDIWVTRADGTGYRGEGEPINLTRHPDGDNQMSLSADGRVMAFISRRVNDEYDVWMAYLDENLETLTPQELASYYEELAKNVKKLKDPSVPDWAKRRGSVSPKVEMPADAEDDAGNVAATQPATQPDTQPATQPGDGKDDESPVDVADLDDLALDNVYLRLQRVSREPGSEFGALILPDASAIYYTAGGKLMKKPWDDDVRETGSAVSIQGVNLTGTTLVYVSAGKGGTQATGGNNARESFDADDRLEINLAEENERKFRELSRILGVQFYHPTMKDLDWPQLIDDYAPLAHAARTPDEFEHVSMKLLGELNGSHLGVSAPGDGRPARQNYGRLGVRAIPNDKGFEVVEVMETGPAGRGDMKILVGDVITKLELEPVDLDRPLEVQLPDKVGREIIVTVQRDGAEVNLLLTPASYGSITSEAYESWRLANHRKVEEMSGGRLGYIHVQAMNQGSLDVFERDLYAAAEGKDGLLVDVRNNGGGSTADRLLASLMYPRHAYTIPRGMQESVDAGRANMQRGGYPQDRLYIQRYSLPTNMLANENSFSNAEIIAHAFKALDRGTLIGEETAGGVISTGAFSLVDGTSVRLPFRGWYLLDGTDMENNGAMPDIRVVQTPEAEVAGEDAQLEAAVRDLMERLPAAAADAE